MVLSNAERQRRWRENHRTLAAKEIKAQHAYAQAARDYNPTLNAMADTQAEMCQVLDSYTSIPATSNNGRSKAVKLHNRIKGGIDASASLAVYNACLGRLHALRSQFDSSYEPLLQLFMQNVVPAHADGAAVAPAAAAAAPAVPPLPPPPHVPPAQPPVLFAQPGAPARGVVQSTSASGRPVDLSRVLACLPKTHREKYRMLHDYIGKHPDVIGSTDRGRLTIHGNTVQDALFTDVVRALYANPRGTMSAIEPGLLELVGALREIGVPRTLISSSTARAQYALQGVPPHVSSSSSTQTDVQRTSQAGTGNIGSCCFPMRARKRLRVY